MKGGYRPFKLPPLPPAKIGQDFHENGGPCPRSLGGSGDTGRHEGNPDSSLCFSSLTPGGGR